MARGRCGKQLLPSIFQILCLNFNPFNCYHSLNVDAFMSIRNERIVLSIFKHPIRMFIERIVDSITILVFVLQIWYDFSNIAIIQSFVAIGGLVRCVVSSAAPCMAKDSSDFSPCVVWFITTLIWNWNCEGLNWDFSFNFYDLF